MKISDAEAAVDKEWEKLENLPAWQVTKFNIKKEGSLKRHKKRKGVSTLPHWSIYVTSRTRSWSRSSQDTKVASCSEVMVRKTTPDLTLYVCRVGFVSITNDCRNRSGRYCQTTWMRRTSKRRSIRLHPGQNERRSNTVGTSCVWVSRYLGTSATMQMAIRMAEHWRTNRAFGQDFIRTCCRSDMGKTIREFLLQYGWVKVPHGNVCSFIVNKDYSHPCAWTTSRWQERNTIWSQCGHIWWTSMIWRQQRRSLIKYTWDALGVDASRSKISSTNTETYSIPEFPQDQQKSCKRKWRSDSVVLRRDRTCTKISGKVLRIGKQKHRALMKSPHIVSTIISSSKRNWKRWENCQKGAFKCLFLARIGRPDILWSVNKLTRAVTKQTRACDRRLTRLISCIHNTCEYKQFCHVENTAEQCRLGLFQDADFAGDLEDSKSTSGGILCIFGSRTLVPNRWMCKEQTAVSHSSTESEHISLDVGLRMDGIPALDFWDLVIHVLHSSPTPIGTVKSDALRLQCATHPKIRTKLNSFTLEESCLKEIDHVDTNAKLSHHSTLLYIFEDNEAVIKMIIKDRSSAMRHVSRTHRVALDWLFDRINLDPHIQIKYVDTRSQLANIFSKETFVPNEWKHLLPSFNVSDVSVFLNNRWSFS